MPLATDEEVSEFVEKYGPFRLGCRKCSRDDYNGVRELPDDWDDIREQQSLRESMSVYDGDDDPAPSGYSLLEWETHKGTCPECKS